MINYILTKKFFLLKYMRICAFTYTRGYLYETTD